MTLLHPRIDPSLQLFLNWNVRRSIRGHAAVKCGQQKLRYGPGAQKRKICFFVTKTSPESKLLYKFLLVSLTAAMAPNVSDYVKFELQFESKDRFQLWPWFFRKAFSMKSQCTSSSMAFSMKSQWHFLLHGIETQLKLTVQETGLSWWWHLAKFDSVGLKGGNWPN